MSSAMCGAYTPATVLYFMCVHVFDSVPLRVTYVVRDDIAFSLKMGLISDKDWCLLSYEL